MRESTGEGRKESSREWTRCWGRKEKHVLESGEKIFSEFDQRRLEEGERKGDGEKIRVLERKSKLLGEKGGAGEGNTLTEEVMVSQILVEGSLCCLLGYTVWWWCWRWRCWWRWWFDNSYY